MLQKGDKAPDFSAANQNGDTVSLAQYAGKKLIVFFYPKDSSPGCTAEACNLNDNLDMWHARGYEIIGVSKDSVASHKRFAEKYSFRFDLISDADTSILRAYGAWGEKKNYGKTYEGTLRSTFVINEQGIIDKVFAHVDTKNHSEQLLKGLE